MLDKCPARLPLATNRLVGFASRAQNFARFSKADAKRSRTAPSICGVEKTRRLTWEHCSEFCQPDVRLPLVSHCTPDFFDLNPLSFNH
jgi:hypothetical protein